ncbi:MAG TPA: class I SAM-dependent methyltransferase [Bryobacteraceae bacterium]
MSATGQMQVTPERIMQLAWGHCAPVIMDAAIQHGVFESLNDGPKTVEETAAQTGASRRGLRAIMNALAGLELLTKDADGRFSLTPESSAFLVGGKPAYLGGLIRHTTHDLIPQWQELGEIVHTGKSKRRVNQEQTGAKFFHDFVTDIMSLSFGAAEALARELAVAEATAPLSVLDVAAGSAVWSIVLAQASPQVRVTAVDWPGVLDVTRETTAKYGVADRYTYVGGDLDAADFGKNHDIAVLGHILHMEGETRGRALLRRVFRSMKRGGTIAIQEFLVDDDRSGPPMGLLFAVNMLVATDEGDTYSAREIAGWLREAGFVNPRTVAAPGPSPLLLATRPA